MEIRGWEERYRCRERPAEDFAVAPVPLLAETAKHLPPGRALDLACGTGRNALWLAQHGWSVTAVDGAPTAIESMRRRASEASLTLDARVADLERGEYRIEPSAWDLICICYYLQRDLFETAKQGLAPGGVLIVIVHIAGPGEQPTAHRLRPGELESYFRGWEILHHYEGQPSDPVHQRPVAEIVVRRPDDIAE
jgi:SAM-dependent methyltransferase